MVPPQRGWWRRLGVVENDATGTWRPGDARARPVGAEATELDVLLELLARALGLERAALLVEQTAGGVQVPVATWGAVRLPSLDPASEPPNGPWSAVLVLESSGRPFGRALLAAPGGRSLPPAARALASRLVDGATALLARTQLEHDLVRARELLARADRLAVLGTLAAGVAHEVRNPLVSVRTFIELLPERLHDEEFRTSFRDLTLAEIERICALLNDLLAFARPAPGQRGGQRSECAGAADRPAPRTRGPQVRGLADDPLRGRAGAGRRRGGAG